MSLCYATIMYNIVCLLASNRWWRSRYFTTDFSTVFIRYTSLPQLIQLALFNII